MSNNIFVGNFFHCKKREDGLAILTFDDKNEKFNKLSKNALIELDDFLEMAKAKTDIKCLLIISGKKDSFIVGADINEIKDISDPQDAMNKAGQGQLILHKISLLPYPTVSAINGACLGGGLELALACNYRIVSDHKKTSLGLPEVQLGIIPGFGGTQRLPRLIGLAESLPLILTSKQLNGEKAFKMKLADALVASEFFEEHSILFAEEIVKKGKHSKSLLRRKKPFMHTILDSAFFRGVIFKMSLKTIIQKTGRHYPAPIAALHAVKEGFNLSMDAALKKEIQHFGTVAAGKICKNLIQLYFTNEGLKKEFAETETSNQNISNSVGVLGAGVMGGGIAWLFSNKGYHVRIKDISWPAILLGYQSCKKIYDQLVKIRKMKKKELSLYMSRLSGTLDYTGFAHVEIVVEAILENLEIKKKTFIELESHVSASTILATNTSALSVNEMAAGLKHPERFVGVHFFNPVNRMPLVEVIAADKTSEEVMIKTVSLVRKLGKTPIVVKDCPGFLVNRILTPYVNEAVYLLQEGADIKTIDKTMENFGMPMGPLVLADNVGLDVGYKVAKILETSYGQRMAAPAFLEEMHKMPGLLGKKTGRGFYFHPSLKPNQTLLNGLKAWQVKNNIQPKQIDSKEIENRLLCALINEASRCIEENIVKNVAYLDMAMIMGTGFPPFRGGVLRYADEIGLAKVLENLQRFAKENGQRYAPSGKLLQMVERKQTFY
jgi:3-hydroxyacyl-CoA dehydrogenase/enoyl-CoA hydratase/3-hydroxybutyryl-CoA epimerase